MEDYSLPIVIDNGSGMIKAGFAGDREPESTFPSVIWKIPSKGIKIGMGGKETWIGKEIRPNIPLEMTSPFKKGIIENMNDMERIWFHLLYNELKVAPEEHAILMSDNCWNPPEIREKISQIMFEDLNILSLNISDQSALSLIASLKSTGVVFGSGEQITSAVPVFEGHPIPDSVSLIDFSGKQITEHLIGLLNLSDTPEKRLLAREIKEKLCYVSLDFEEEMKKEIEMLFELPDGQKITIGNERFRAVEPLFNFSKFTNQKSIQNSIFDSIWKIDGDLSNNLFSNIILSGGSTLFLGMKERIEKELKETVKELPLQFKVDCSHNKNLAWYGGSLLFSTSSFRRDIVTRDQYDENGPSIVHNFFF